jgi:hypothetical protein
LPFSPAPLAPLVGQSSRCPILSASGMAFSRQLACFFCLCPSMVPAAQPSEDGMRRAGSFPGVLLLTGLMRPLRPRCTFVGKQPIMHSSGRGLDRRTRVPEGRAFDTDLDVLSCFRGLATQLCLKTLSEVNGQLSYGACRWNTSASSKTIRSTKSNNRR